MIPLPNSSFSCPIFQVSVNFPHSYRSLIPFGTIYLVMIAPNGIELLSCFDDTLSRYLFFYSISYHIKFPAHKIPSQSHYRWNNEVQSSSFHPCSLQLQWCMPNNAYPRCHSSDMPSSPWTVPDRIRQFLDRYKWMPISEHVYSSWELLQVLHDSRAP